MVTELRQFYEPVVQPDTNIRRKNQMRYEKDKTPQEKLAFALRVASRFSAEQKLYVFATQHASKAMATAGEELVTMQKESIRQVINLY